MNSFLSELQTKIERLSHEQQVEVANLVESLLNKEQSRPRRKMKMDWAGGLQHLRDQYTSVELQKEANRWREESALAHIKDEGE